MVLPSPGSMEQAGAAHPNEQRSALDPLQTPTGRVLETQEFYQHV